MSKSPWPPGPFLLMSKKGAGGIRLFAHGPGRIRAGLAAAKGRPKRGDGEMPLPKQLKDTERLAGVLAYLESSEKGPSATLEEDAREAYGRSNCSM